MHGLHERMHGLHNAQCSAERLLALGPYQAPLAALLAAQIPGYPTSVAALAFNASATLLAVAASYTFEQVCNVLRCACCACARGPRPALAGRHCPAAGQKVTRGGAGPQRAAASDLTRAPPSSCTAGGA